MITTKTQKKFSKHFKQKRFLRMEPLEQRLLLASDWQNSTRATDVDDSGYTSLVDVLLVVDHFREYGLGRPLPSASSAGAPYVDVNGDGDAGIDDLIQIIAEFRAGVSMPSPEFSVRAVDDGNVDGVLADDVFQGEISQGFRSQATHFLARADDGPWREVAVDADGAFAFDMGLADDGSADGEHVLEIVAQNAASPPNTIRLPFTLRAQSNTPPSGQDEDAVLSVLAGDLEEGLAALAHSATAIANNAAELPILGDDIVGALRPILTGAFALELPQSGVRDYLQSRGFTVQSLVSADELTSGLSDELVVLTYAQSFVANPIEINASGALGESGGVHLEFSGQLIVQPSLEVQLTLGVDRDGGFFVQEGASASLSLTVDASGPGGELTANVDIPGLTSVTGTAGAPSGRHLVDAGVELLVSDFDPAPNERFFLTAGEHDALVDVIAQERAIALDGVADLQATLSVENPLSQLPAFLRDNLPIDTIVDLPQSITWSADIHYDMVTGKLEYEISGNSLREVIELFQQSDSLEDALFDFMLDKVAEHNPIPESVQQFLGTTIPLVEMNVLDLLEVPRPAQYLIAPSAFGNQSASGDQADDFLSFNLDLFSAENLEKMLSGEAYDILSVDFDQRFEKELGSITVLPETLLFSYLGVVNVTLALNLTPGFFFEIDVTMGMDSEGVYLLGVTPGDGVVEPHFTFGGELTLSGDVEVDLVYLIDFLKVTVGVGLEAFGDFTIESLHADDPKVRVDEIHPDRIKVGLGVNMNLNLEAEFGLLDFGIATPLVEREHAIELYRHQSGTSLSDIESRVQSFKSEIETKGRAAIYAGASTGEPLLVMTASYLLYHDTQDYIEVARALVVDHGVSLINAAKGMWDGLPDIEIGDLAAALGSVSDSISDIAEALWDNATTSLDTLADVLWNDIGWTSIADVAKGLGAVSGDIIDIAHALYDEVTTNLHSLADAMWSISWTTRSDIARALAALSSDIHSIADALFDEVTANVDRLAEALFDGAGFAVETIADALNDGLSLAPSSIADALWGNGFFSSFGDDAALELAKVLDDEIFFADYADDFATVLFNGAGFTVETIADVFDDGLDFSPTFIADALWGNGFFSSFGDDAARELAKVLDDEIFFADYADDFATVLFNGAGFTVETIADVFDDGLDFSPTFIADALWGNGFFSSFGSNGARELARVLDDEIFFADYADNFATALFNGAGFGVETIADVFDDGMDFSPIFIADALWGNGFFSSFGGDGAGELVKVLRREALSTEGITSALSNELGFSSSSISNAFAHIGISVSVSSINNFLNGSVGGVVSSASSVGEDLWNGLNDLF